MAFQKKVKAAVKAGVMKAVEEVKYVVAEVWWLVVLAGGVARYGGYASKQELMQAAFFAVLLKLSAARILKVLQESVKTQQNMYEKLNYIERRLMKANYSAGVSGD